MKKTLIITLLLGLGAATSALAADAKVTLTGEGKCAKCALKETDECQNVVVVEEAGKKVTYYFAKNDISDKFHGTICKAAKPVKAIGTWKEEKGKKMLTVTEVTEVKK